jgi:hypothetical protein
MTPIINTRADLDALAGTPAFIAALTQLNATRSVSLTILERFGFPSDAEWEAYLASAGHPLEKPAPYVAPIKSLDEARKEAKAKLGTRRFEVETGGVVVSSAPVATDRQSQSMILAALVQLAADEKVQWKGSDGIFRETTRDQLAAIARAVKNHVQACFAREAELVELLDLATTTEDIESLSDEIAAFWPASS